MHNQSDVRALELFAGIGGFAHAVAPWPVDVVGALDMSSHVLQWYAYNYEHATKQQNLEVITAKQLHAYQAQLWWMSPPCQPYTVRGLQKDLEDHRARSFLRLLDILEDEPPEMLAMENVEGFYDAEARQRLLAVLARHQFEVLERVVCPTELGIPARRARYYLVASRGGLQPVAPAPYTSRCIAQYLEDDVDASYIIDPAILAKHGRGMRMVEAIDDPQCHANCFTSAYGKTYRFAGSYLKTDAHVRYFTPRELLRFLGYDDSFKWPESLSRKQLYKYIGNSLSIDVLRYILQPLGLYDG